MKRSAPQRFLSAFTMIELLIVLVISGLLLIIIFSFGLRSRNAFVSQQALKTLLLDLRTARRKSMLVTKNTGEGWVYGVGVEIWQNSASEPWQFKTIRAIGPGVDLYYETYPTGALSPSVNLVDLGEKPPQELPIGLNFVMSTKAGASASWTPTTCTRVRILFESINGALHLYCDMNPLTPANIKQLGIGISTSNTKVIVGTNGDLSPGN